jgi:ATP-binding cassette subfamily B protein
MGPERSLGGYSRTFGLKHRYEDAEPKFSVAFDGGQLRRVLGYFLSYWRQWLFIFACIAATAALGVLPPLAVRGILDHAIPNGDLRLLWLLVGIIIGLKILFGLIGVLQNYVNARVGEGIVFDLRNELFRHLQKMSLAFHTAACAGEIVARIHNDVAAVQGTATATKERLLQHWWLL